METSEINKEAVRKCIFCFKSSNFNSESQNRISGIIQDIYINCMKYINSDYLTEDVFRNWCRPNPLPFCKKCLKCSYKLNRMNQKLEQIQKQIEQLVSSFTTEFLKSRENPNNCAEDDSEEEFSISNYLQTELQDENANNESVRIKEEPNDQLDYFDDDESSPLSPFGTSNQDSNNDTYFSQQETKPVIKHGKKLNGKRKKKKRPRNKKSFPKRLKNASESVNQRRLQTDADGNPIPESDLLPRRKAAMKAEETFVALKHDLDNFSDKEQLEGSESDSETSASGDEFNPSVKEEGVHDSTKPRKIQKKVDTRRKRRHDADKDRPFGCVQCNKFYTTRSHLQEHILTHDESNRFKCTICEDVSFAYIRGLRQHMFKHKHNLLDQTTWKCKKCDLTFKTSKEFKDHNKEIHKNMIYDCSKCKVTYNSRKSLQQHSLEIHNLHLTDEGMKIYADGNPVPESDLLPKRKSAIKAEETFVSLKDDLDNLSDKEQIEGDVSDSEEWKGAGTRRKRRNDKEKPFKCVHCNKFFTTKSHLQEHILTHDKNNRFKCTICEDVSFAYVRGLRQHMFKHKNDLLDETTLKCNKCDTTFKTSKEFRHHNREIHKNWIYICSVCGESYSFFQSLQQHCLEIHKFHLTYKDANKDADGNPIPYEDLVARRKAAVKAKGISVSGTDDLEDQILIQGGISDSEESASGEEFNPSADDEDINDSDESGKKQKRSGAPRKIRKGAGKFRPFECVKCNKFYTSKSHLQDHIITHSKENRFKCTICEDVSFAYSQGLRQHMFKHKNNLLVEKIFKCKKCDTTFKTRKELKDHNRENHKDIIFECSVCGVSFTFLKSLQQHSLEVHELHLTYEGEQLSVTSEKPEIDILTFCNICNKHFKNADTLKGHQRKIHGPLKKRCCHLCFKEFRTDIGLKEHVDRHNRDPNVKVETKYKCHICQKFLSSRGSLNRHILAHSNVKPFECSLKCGKWFSTKSHAKHHLLFHKGERTFLCDECGKSFFTRSNLNDHTRIHTGLLHYCELCGKGFQTTTHLKQHHRSHKKDIDTAAPIEPPPPPKSDSQEGLLMNLLPTLPSDVSSANFLLQY